MNGQSQLNVFDGLADGYDESFTDRAPGRWLRSMVFKRVSNRLPERARILEVGCGTGEDAMHFAECGHSVIATDVSEAMLAQARRKIESMPPAMQQCVQLQLLDAADPANAGLAIEPGLDLVYSNFGALNCVADLQPLFDYANDYLRPGGHVALVLMGRFCLWETIGFTLRGDLRRATRRWSGSSRFEIDGISQTINYPTVGALKRCLPGNFKAVSISGIGALLPTTEFSHLCERWPRFFSWLSRVENKISVWWPFSRLSDHYLIVIRKAQVST